MIENGTLPVLRSSRTRTWILLVCVLTGATMLRFYALDFQSLWNDELASWKMSTHSDLSTVIFREAVGDFHPPGYHIMLHYWMKHFGDSERILRLPSAIAGVMSVAMVFLLGAHLYSIREGLLASAIMAVLWCPIFYSQMARVYSILMFVILINIYFWALTTEDILSIGQPVLVGHMAPYVAASIIACYLHYYALIIISVQALLLGSVVWIRRSGLLWFATTYMLILLAYSPWIPIMLRHADMEFTWFHKPTIIYFLYYLEFIFNKSWYFLLIMTGIVLASTSNWLIRRIHNPLTTSLNKRTLITDLGILLWLFGPFCIVFAICLMGKPILRFYGLIYCVPAACLLLARAVFGLPLKDRAQVAVGTGLVIVFLWHLTGPMRFYSDPHSERFPNHPQWDQFREAVYFVTDHKFFRSEAIVLSCPSRELFQYYLFRRRAAKDIDLCLCDGSTIPELEKLLYERRPKYMFLIWANKFPAEDIIQYMISRARLIDHAKFIAAGVMVFSLEDRAVSIGNHSNRRRVPRPQARLGMQSLPVPTD